MIGTVCFAQAGPDLSVSQWATLITNGGFAALVWYIIVYHLPKMTKEFREELAAERSASLRREDAISVERKEWRDAFDRWRKPLSDAVQLLSEIKPNEQGH